LPDWLSGAPRVDSALVPRGLSPEGKALLFQQFETVFPRVLEMVCGGYTIAQALRELPISIDAGAFSRWIHKSGERKELLREAKEIRTEEWTGLMVKHALGEDVNGEQIPTELDRSKFIVDTLKWLVSRENRKQYGDTKTIEMNTTISITAALEQAQGRIIEAQVIGDDDDDDDVDVIDVTEYKQLSAGSDDEDEE
jgi:hypothetical protein